MTTPTETFTHLELTPIPLDQEPTFTSLHTIHQQINANAITVTSLLGGGHYGHLALVLPAATYNTLPNAVAWVDPVHPGPNPAHPAAATAAQITEANRQYKVDIETFLTFQATGAALKKQILAAVPETFTKQLKDRLFGYDNVSARELLAHLDDTYGTVSADDLQDNVERMDAAWSPTQPIEDLWNQILDAQSYAEPHDPITAPTAVRSAIQNLTNYCIISFQIHGT